MKRIIIIFSLIINCFSLSAQTEDYAMTHQGNRAFQRGEWAKAEQCYRKALQTDPRNARALFNLGDAYLAQKNGKDALECFLKAAKIEKNKAIKAMAYHNIGFIHHNNKEYDKAIDYYKEALRNNPHDEDTRYNLALCKKQQKEQQQDKEQEKNQNNQEDPQSNQQNQNDKNQQQSQQNQISEDNIEQLLNLAKQAEQQTRQKLDKAQQPRKKQSVKNW